MNPAPLMKKFFDRFYDMPLFEWENYCKLGEIITVGKEKILKEAYSTEKYLNFFIKGSGGILLWNKNNFI